MKKRNVPQLGLVMLYMIRVLKNRKVKARINTNHFWKEVRAHYKWAAGDTTWRHLASNLVKHLIETKVLSRTDLKYVYNVNIINEWDMEAIFKILPEEEAHYYDTILEKWANSTPAVEEVAEEAEVVEVTEVTEMADIPDSAEMAAEVVAGIAESWGVAAPGTSMMSIQIKTSEGIGAEAFRLVKGLRPGSRMYKETVTAFLEKVWEEANRARKLVRVTEELVEAKARIKLYEKIISKLT